MCVMFSCIWNSCCTFEIGIVPQFMNGDGLKLNISYSKWLIEHMIMFMWLLPLYIHISLESQLRLKSSEHSIQLKLLKRQVRHNHYCVWHHKRIIKSWMINRLSYSSDKKKCSWWYFLITLKCHWTLIFMYKKNFIFLMRLCDSYDPDLKPSIIVPHLV